MTKPAGCFLQFIGAGLLVGALLTFTGSHTGVATSMLVVAIVLLWWGRQPAVRK